MARTATTGHMAAAEDTHRGFSQMHGVGKMAFKFAPSTGTTVAKQHEMREKIKMKPPKGTAPGKTATERGTFPKGLIVRGKAKLMG
jgi:hypothetical protein